MSGLLFSVVIPTYNRAQFISQALESVLNQAYANFEIIIVDDGSTDDTKKVVQGFADKRVKYFWKENEERGAARNFGISKSSGDYICFLDSDDVYYYNHLKEAVIFLESNNDCEFFYQPFEIKNPLGAIRRQHGFNSLSIKSISNNNILCPIGAFIRRDIAQKHPFDPDPKFTFAEDMYVWLILTIRYGIKLNPKYTSCLIEHSGRSMVTVDIERANYCVSRLKHLLKIDSEFKNHQRLIKLVESSQTSLLALYASMGGNKDETIKLLKKAVTLNFLSIFRLRTLVIIRNLILN